MALDRRTFLRSAAVSVAVPPIVAAVDGVAGAAPRSAEPGVADLSIFTSGYPRLFVYRMAGQLAAEGMPYEQWAEMFEPYDGIVAKAYNENFRESRAAARDYMIRFKREHPEKMILDHYYALCRSVNLPLDDYFAGSWVYYPGQAGLSAVAATTDDTVISVADPMLYKSTAKVDDNLVITGVGTDGRPDWNYAEQVVLLAQDAAAKTITVRRAQYGTDPLAFPAGEMYIAAHATGGGGALSPVMWEVNYSAAAPRDAAGRNGGEIYAAEIAGHFASGGLLEEFDGIVFDVLGRFFKKNRSQKVDTDGDGVGDDGLIDGVDHYLPGIYEFGTHLRQHLGDDKLILGDGAVFDDQRNIGVFNGSENEGWPQSNDPHIDQWSSGINRVQFWNEYGARKPHNFSYVQLHYRLAHQQDDGYVPYPNYLRLLFAASQLTGSAMTYGSWQWTPGAVKPVGGQWSITDWDEMVCGTEKTLHWLGQPRHDPVVLARRTRDVLRGAGIRMHADFTDRMSGDNLETQRRGRWLTVSAPTDDGQTVFTIAGVPARGPDLTVFCRLSADLRAGQHTRLFSLDVIDPTTGEVINPKRLGTLVGKAAFDASFYASAVSSPTVDLRVTVEGVEPVCLSSLTVHTHPDARLREFDHGLVLANPAEHELTIDITKYASGRGYHRINGSADQDPVTNNGQPVGRTVRLGARDGLFLVAD